MFSNFYRCGGLEMQEIPLNQIIQKFHIEFLSPHNREITISYYETIDKDQKLKDHLKNIMGETYELNHSLDLPVFYKDGTVYKLVSRYWLLDFINDHRQEIDTFPAIIFTDSTLIPKIQKHENFLVTQFYKNECSQKTEALPLSVNDATTTRGASYQTELRTDLRTSGRTCPKPNCKGVLVRDQKLNKEKPQEHWVSCQNKNNQPPCTFHARLTQYESIPFKKKLLKTSEWIFLLPNVSCVKCKGLVFRRLIYKNDKDLQIIDRCAKYYLEQKPSCKWASVKKPEEVSYSSPDLGLEYYGKPKNQQADQEEARLREEMLLKFFNSPD